MMSRRSLSSSSSSSTERRSSSMSQWVRGGLTFLGSGSVALDQGALHAVAAQPGAGDLGVVGERNLELLAVVGAVRAI